MPPYIYAPITSSLYVHVSGRLNHVNAVWFEWWLTDKGLVGWEDGGVMVKDRSTKLSALRLLLLLFLRKKIYGTDRSQMFFWQSSTGSQSYIQIQQWMAGIKFVSSFTVHWNTSQWSHDLAVVMGGGAELVLSLTGAGIQEYCVTFHLPEGSTGDQRMSK